MAFLVKVDEDLPHSVVRLLLEHDYDAVSVSDQGMNGWKDPTLWKTIQKEGRFLITADKGFADIRAYPLGKHAGILLLRPDEDGIRPTMDLLTKLLATHR
jgi:predicted nuclease of predicted toxin-antitoxin system